MSKVCMSRCQRSGLVSIFDPVSTLLRSSWVRFPSSAMCLLTHLSQLHALLATQLGSLFLL